MFLGLSESCLMAAKWVSSSCCPARADCDACDSGCDGRCNCCCVTSSGWVTGVGFGSAAAGGGAIVGSGAIVGGSCGTVAASTRDWTTSNLPYMSNMRSSCFFILCSRALHRSWPRSEDAEIFCDTCRYLKRRPKESATKKVAATNRDNVTASSSSAMRRVTLLGHDISVTSSHHDAAQKDVQEL